MAVQKGLGLAHGCAKVVKRSIIISLNYWNQGKMREGHASGAWDAQSLLD